MPPAHRGPTGAPMDRWTTASPTAIASGFHAAMALGPQPKLSDQHYNNGSASGIAGGGMGTSEFVSDDDEEEDEDEEDGSPASGLGKKKGKAKTTKKGGARGKDPAALLHRKEQNRTAQREFRQRKQQYIRALEARVELLSSDHDTQVDRLRFALRMLLQENNALRDMVGSLASFIGNKSIGGVLQETGFSRQELEKAMDSRSEKTLTEAWQNWPGAKECEALQQIRKESNIPPDGLPESRLPFGAGSSRPSEDALSVEEKGKRRTASLDATGKKRKTNGGAAHETTPTTTTTATPPSAMLPPFTASPDQNRIANELWQLQQQQQQLLLLQQQQQQRPAPEANFFQNLFGDAMTPTATDMFGSFNASTPASLGYGVMGGFVMQPSPTNKPPSPTKEGFSQDFQQRGRRIVVKVNRLIAKKGGTQFVRLSDDDTVSEADKRAIDEEERTKPYLMLAQHRIEGAYEEDWDLANNMDQSERMLEAFIQASYHMNNYRHNPAYQLPPALKPSRVQQQTPHDPFIDDFLSPGMRDGLIRNPQLDVDEVAFEMLRWTELHEGDAQLESQWEPHRPFLVRFPMLVDEKMLKISNAWRKSRGQEPLTMQQIWKDHEIFKVNRNELWKNRFGAPFPLTQ